jgi:hypothetical protein
LRLDPNLRWLVYLTIAVLFVTGIVWWFLDPAASRTRFYLIAAHGLAAMVFLGAMGAVIALHIGESWRRRRNRWIGTILGALVIALIVSAYGLYYAGSDSLREAISVLHLVAGAILPLLLAIHVVIGIRSRPDLDDLDDPG